MSTRNRVLFVCFLLLAGAAVLVEQPWRGDAFERTLASIQPVFPGLEAQLAQVAQVEIQAGAESTLLQRGASGWVVANLRQHPADPFRLLQLLEGLARLTTRDRVSDNPEHWKDYAVTEEAGTRVRLLDARGGVIAELLSGGLRKQEAASGARASLDFYVRRAGSPEVILAHFQPPPASPQAWLDGELLPRGTTAAMLDWIQRFDPEGGESWRAVRVQSEGSDSMGVGWRLVAPEEGAAQALECEAFAQALVGLSAADVVERLAPGEEPAADFGFATNVVRAGVGDLRYELRFGRPAPGNGRYAWIEGANFVYVVPEAAAERLRPAVETMAAEE